MHFLVRWLELEEVFHAFARWKGIQREAVLTPCSADAGTWKHAGLHPAAVQYKDEAANNPFGLVSTYHEK